MVGIACNMFSGYSGLLSFGHAAFFGLGAYAVRFCTSSSISRRGWRPARHGRRGHRRRDHRLSDVPAARALLRARDARLSPGAAVPLRVAGLPGGVAANGAGESRQRTCSSRTRACISRSALACWSSRSRSRSRSRARASGCRCSPSSRTSPPRSRRASTRSRWKLRAIVLSGAIAAGIGGFYAVVLLIVTPPSVFGMLTSAQALIVTLFGGMATVWGPVVGSAMLIPLAEVLHAELGDIIPGIQGVVFGVGDRARHPTCPGRYCSPPTRGTAATARRGDRRLALHRRSWPLFINRPR